MGVPPPEVATEFIDIALTDEDDSEDDGKDDSAKEEEVEL